MLNNVNSDRTATSRQLDVGRGSNSGKSGGAGVMVHLHLKFNKLDKTYLPDEDVKCEWQVSLSNPIKLRCLYVRYRGDARVKWSETGTLVKDGKKHTEYMTYRGDKNYFKYYVTLCGMRNGPHLILEPGVHKFVTCFRLPKLVPESYEAKDGHIRYSVKLHMEMTSKPDDLILANYFKVAPQYDLNGIPSLKEPVRDEQQKTFGCCCFESDPLTLTTFLPSQGFVPGERFRLFLQISNDSDMKIRSTHIKLKEIISYHAQRPAAKVRTRSRVLWAHSFQGVGLLVMPCQKKLIELEVFLDPNYSFKVFGGCDLISVEYLIKTELVPSKFFKSLISQTRIIVGTVPFKQDEQDQASSTLSIPIILLSGPDEPSDAAACGGNTVITEQPLPADLPLPDYHSVVGRLGEYETRSSEGSESSIVDLYNGSCSSIEQGFLPTFDENDE